MSADKDAQTTKQILERVVLVKVLCVYLLYGFLSQIMPGEELSGVNTMPCEQCLPGLTDAIHELNKARVESLQAKMLEDLLPRIPLVSA